MSTAKDELTRLQGAFDGITPWQGAVREGRTPNFLGVMTDLKFTDPAAGERPPHREQGTVATDLPTLTDGELYFEWLDVLAAVREARGRFTMVELGGGYAARCVNAHAALSQLNPMQSFFVIVEAEPTHFVWAKEHFANNGLDWRDHWFVNAVINDTNDPVLFAIAEGLYSNCIASEAFRAEVAREIAAKGIAEPVLANLLKEFRMGVSNPVTNGSYQENVDYAIVSSVTMGDILGPLDRVDYMDVDIQRAEEFVLPASIDLLNRKVRRIHVGTHCHKVRDDIHHGIDALFRDHGWDITVSLMPHTRHQTDLGDISTSDGIVSAINPRLG